MKRQKSGTDRMTQIHGEGKRVGMLKRKRGFAKRISSERAPPRLVYIMALLAQWQAQN